MATVPLTMVTKEAFEEISEAFRRYEVARGELVEVPPMGNIESAIAMRIGAELINHLGVRAAMQVLGSDARFRLARDPDLIRGCDVSFVPAERMPNGRPESGVGDYVPALVVEVISRSNKAAETVRKIQEWFDAGASLVWIVYPEQETVYVYQAPDRCQILHSDGKLDGGAVLPGFHLELQTLFA